VNDRFERQNMEEIFLTKERIKILKAIIFKESAVSVNAIANHLEISKGLVSKYLNILTKRGIAKIVNGKFTITNSAFVKGIKILLNLDSIKTSIFKKYAFVKSAGLYGSCARGGNNEESDVDLWVRVSGVTEDKMASLSSMLSKKIKSVKVLFLTDEKIEKLKKEDALFYYSLTFGSIIIYGDKQDVQL